MALNQRVSAQRCKRRIREIYVNPHQASKGSRAPMLRIGDRLSPQRDQDPGLFDRAALIPYDLFVAAAAGERIGCRTQRRADEKTGEAARKVQSGPPIGGPPISRVRK